MPKAGYIQDARRYYYGLIVLGALYVLVVTAEAVIYGVGFFEFLRVGYGILLLAMKVAFLLFCMGAAAFVYGFFKKGGRGFGRFAVAREHCNKVSYAYLQGEVFAYGCVGVLALAPAIFYFVQKSLIEFVNPYEWDEALSHFDYLLHFRHYPDAFIISLVDRFSLGPLIDISYFFWFGVMYMGLSYNVFWDNNRRRRLRFLWVFVLCWVVLGSVMGAIFSSVGPIYYHDFFPAVDPYHDLVIYNQAHGPEDFPIAYYSNHMLLLWTIAGRMVNPNAIAAFPSLHMAIAWLTMLYFWGINRIVGVMAGIFTVLIYIATILFGFHYAVDSYVSIVVVSLMWWGMGRYINSRIPATAPPLQRLATD